MKYATARDWIEFKDFCEGSWLRFKLCLRHRVWVVPIYCVLIMAAAFCFLTGMVFGAIGRGAK